jgi:anti-anti-sigma factor
MKRISERDQGPERSVTGQDAQTREGAGIAFVRDDPKVLHVKLSGRLDAHTTAELWQKAASHIRSGMARKVVVDASEVSYCDGAGAGLLTYLAHVGRQEIGRAHV